MALASFPFLWHLHHVAVETPTEWIDDNVHLSKEASHKDGKFESDYTPYIRGPQNAFAEHAISAMTFCAGTQVVKTQFFLNAMSWAIGQRPGPMLYVMPTKDVVRKFIQDKFITQMESSPNLIKFFRDDLGKGTNQLFQLNNEMNIAFGYAGSSAALSSSSIRYLFLDEVDKFKSRLGKESSPFKLAGERLKAYTGKSKLLAASTPTKSDGLIWQRLQSSIQHMYYVPCPHCRKKQVFVFENIQKPKDVTDSDALRHAPVAWYECGFCNKRILDKHKKWMLKNGTWQVKDSDKKRFDFEVNRDGIALAPHVGFHISSIYAPWITFSTVLAEWMDSEKKINEQGYAYSNVEISTNKQNFSNSWLGLPHEEKVDEPIEVKAEVVTGMLNDRGCVPDDAQFLTCHIDIHGQQKGWYAALWAWGSRRRGWLVDYWHFVSGKETTKEWLKDISNQIDEKILLREWKAGEKVLRLYTAVDTGYKGQDKALSAVDDRKSMAKENQGYDFCRKRVRCFAFKGEDLPNSHQIIRPSPNITKENKFFDLFLVNTGLAKTEFTEYYNLGMEMDIEEAEVESGYLQLCNGAQGEFLKSMSSEHAVVDENRKVTWKKKDGYINHPFDNCVNALALAELSDDKRKRTGWGHLKDKIEKKKDPPKNPPPPQTSGRLRTSSGPLGGRRR